MVIKITNSKFINNGTAISAPKDVNLEMDGNILEGNKKGVEIKEDLDFLLKNLNSEVLKSSLDPSSKKRLSNNIISVVKSRKINKVEESKILTALKFVGSKATDLFVQIIANYLSK